MVPALVHLAVADPPEEPVKPCLLLRLRSRALAMGPKHIHLLKENV